MPHGKICYLEIPANRAEDSARFYSDIFGWKVRERGDGNLVFDDPGGVSGTWVEESDRGIRCLRRSGRQRVRSL
jgi:predicted enzyme related to lactoylglutathione lyase